LRSGSHRGAGDPGRGTHQPSPGAAHGVDAGRRCCFQGPVGQESTPTIPGLARRVSSRRFGGVWMAKEEGIEMEGVVTEVLPDRNYRVMLENGHEILAYAAGKMSKFKIRVLEGDRVSVVLSPYDLTRGRVIYRHK